MYDNIKFILLFIHRSVEDKMLAEGNAMLLLMANLITLDNENYCLIFRKIVFEPNKDLCLRNIPVLSVDMVTQALKMMKQEGFIRNYYITENRYYQINFNDETYMCLENLRGAWKVID